VTVNHGNALDTVGQLFEAQFTDFDRSGGWAAGGWAKRLAGTPSGTLLHMRDGGGNTRGEVRINGSGNFEVSHYTSEDVSQSTAVCTMPSTSAWWFWHANFNADGTIDLYVGDEDSAPAEVSYVSNVDAGSGWVGYLSSACEYVHGMRQNETEYWGTTASTDQEGIDFSYLLTTTASTGDIATIHADGTFGSLSTAYLFQFTSSIVDSGTVGGVSIATYYSPFEQLTGPNVTVSGGGATARATDVPRRSRVAVHRASSW
jgi:hypothetical protein